MIIENKDKFLKDLISKVMPQPLSLGIEISSESAKLALVKLQPPDSAYLLDYIIIPLGGKGSTEEKTGLVKNILKEKNIRPDTQAKIIISGPDVDSKRIILPYMPNDEIAKALRWEAKDHFLLNIEESALDFEVLEEKAGEGISKNIEVVANIAKNSLID